MSFPEYSVVALVLYLIALIGVAEFARRSRASSLPVDHFLANRELGLFVLFLTLYSTAYSGNSLLGYPGEAYRRGYVWIMATGFMLAIVVVFHAIVPVLRPIAVRYHFITPGDWIRYRFGGERGSTALRRAVAVLMLIALANFLLAQLIAMGHITESITGGIVPYWVGVVGLALIILVYEVLGGMRAVAWTDAVQGIVMLFGLGILLYWLMQTGGGLEAITLRVAEIRPAAVRVPGAVEQAKWFSSIILLGLASVIYPQAIQRIYAAKSWSALRGSMMLMSFMPLATTAVVTLIGIAAIVHFESLGSVEADTVMPRLLEIWAGEGGWQIFAATLVFIGALAAIMSTADSVLLSLSSLFSGDLLNRSQDDPATTKIGKAVGIVVMVAMAATALSPRFTLWRLIELKMELLIQCVPAFLIAMHWKNLRSAPVFWGLVVGTLISVTSVVFGFKRLAGFHVGVIGLLVNALIAWTGSLVLVQRSR